MVGNVALLAPESRGTVHVTTSDPDVPPSIDPGCLREPADRHALVAGLRRLKDIFETPAMRALLGPCARPAPEEWADDRALLEFATRNADPYWHLTGTARMGANELSVADASVMPTVPRANTQATTIAVAERAADLLTRTWRAAQE
ncbi:MULTISPECIES: GMC oxidoreductase [unclassified Streptomyces]|uniref:GMC oxidoreductase n=1 Tax=unclassified Streptomyces TaxID=2593676 RepID=UPI0037F55B03